MTIKFTDLQIIKNSIKSDVVVAIVFHGSERRMYIRISFRSYYRLPLEYMKRGISP